MPTTLAPCSAASRSAHDAGQADAHDAHLGVDGLGHGGLVDGRRRVEELGARSRWCRPLCRRGRGWRCQPGRCRRPLRPAAPRPTNERRDMVVSLMVLPSSSRMRYGAQCERMPRQQGASAGKTSRLTVRCVSLAHCVQPSVYPAVPRMIMRRILERSPVIPCVVWTRPRRLPVPGGRGWERGGRAGD